MKLSRLFGERDNTFILGLFQPGMSQVARLDYLEVFQTSRLKILQVTHLEMTRLEKVVLISTGCA